MGRYEDNNEMYGKWGVEYDIWREAGGRTIWRGVMKRWEGGEKKQDIL